MHCIQMQVYTYSVYVNVYTFIGNHRRVSLRLLLLFTQTDHMVSISGVIPMTWTPIENNAK